MRTLPELPEDITTDIFTRLPVKSLLRFRCVSKPFLTLIDSPDFIKRHLNHSLETKTNHKLILQQRCTSPNSFYSANLDKLNQTLELDNPLKSDESVTEIIGSVNGLVCLYNGLHSLHNEEEDIVIWNFATGNHQKVPGSEIEFPDYESRIHNIVYGFGYDSISDDYKLLRLVRFYRTYDSEAKVYSLKSNSWQKIKDFPFRISGLKSHGQLACGALHWLVMHNHGSDMTSSIAAFDLASNTYKLVDHPYIQDSDTFDVTKLEGHLSMLCSKSFERTDVWVMEEYGAKESWRKLFSVSNPEVIRNFWKVDPLAYSRSGTEIMLVQDNKKLLWYSLKEGKVGTIRLRGRPDVFVPEICVESLVPLSGKAKDYAKKKGEKDAKEQTNGAKNSLSGAAVLNVFELLFYVS